MDYEAGYYWISYLGEIQIAKYDGFKNWHLCGDDMPFKARMFDILSKQPIEPPNFD